MKVKKGMIRFFGIVGVVVFWVSSYYIGTFIVDVNSYRRLTLEIIARAVVFGMLSWIGIGLALCLCYYLYTYIVGIIESGIKIYKGK